MKFITIRLGKDSIPAIKAIDGLNEGVQKNAFPVSVKCTQVPSDLEVGSVAFVWLGSDNAKGMQTEWKQGFKAIGVVTEVKRGEKYNDESTTNLKVVYIFSQSISRIDILEKAPDAYYCCSSLPIIGLDDRANQTIRSILNEDPLCDVGAFLFALNKVETKFFQRIISILPEIKPYFSFRHPKTGEKKMAAKDAEKNFNRILFGAPGTGKSHKLNDDALIFENQTRTILEKTKDENVIKDEVAKAVDAPKGRKLTSLNAIGFKYADFWKEKTHLSSQEIRNYLKEYKIGGEIYVGAVAKFILDSDALKMTEEELSDVTFIKNLLHDDQKRGDNDKLKWANAIGYKVGEYEEYANMSLKQIISELGIKNGPMWWFYRGIQAARLKEDEESISEEPFVERVTFHPNYSFAQFVGTYKPVQDDEDEKQIKYEYVPGPFMRVYRNAKKNPNNDFLLIIEEINRANVAAVFGDVFQLLDRKNGISEYPVAASEDIQKYLAKYGINERKLSIPDNMYIWATMNSADQGVFPMDTAFKRRWEFEYIGIDENEDGIKDYDVPLQKKEDGSHEWVKWNDLRHSINDKLTEMKINEDKLLGPYFISEEKLKLVEGKKEDNADEFVKSFKSKVLMYLFEDAVKMRPGDLFDENAVGKLRFSDICKKFDEIGQGIFNFKK